MSATRNDVFGLAHAANSLFACRGRLAGDGLLWGCWHRFEPHRLRVEVFRSDAAGGGPPDFRARAGGGEAFDAVFAHPAVQALCMGSTAGPGAFLLGPDGSVVTALDAQRRFHGAARLRRRGLLPVPDPQERPDHAPLAPHPLDPAALALIGGLLADGEIADLHPGHGSGHAALQLERLDALSGGDGAPDAAASLRRRLNAGDAPAVLRRDGGIVWGDLRRRPYIGLVLMLARDD